MGNNLKKENYDFLPALHKELIAVISKYTKVKEGNIKISLDKQDNLEILDVNIILSDIHIT